jgi:transcriptional regulator with XRE-family HTH domain
VSAGSGYAVNRPAAELGRWLREQRRARGWDVPQMARQLAKAAGNNRHTLPAQECLLVYIRRWERGHTGVSERYRLLYCAAYRIEPAAFGPPGWPHTASQPGPASDDVAPAIQDLAAALSSICDTLREDAKRCQARADACAAAAAHIDAAIGDLGAAP